MVEWLKAGKWERWGSDHYDDTNADPIHNEVVKIFPLYLCVSAWAWPVKARYFLNNRKTSN